MLGERLKILRRRKGNSVEEVADSLEFSTSTMISYENGRRRPPIDNIIKLATYYNTSSDYIIGLTDNPLSRKDDQNFKKYLQQNELNWNGIPLTEEELKPIKDLLEIVVRDRLPNKINKSRQY